MPPTSTCPVRLGVRVERLRRLRDGDGFVVTTDAADITCDNVVVATGTFGRTPNVPDFAAGPRPVDPPAALERVPPAGPAPRRTRAGRRRLALRLRHRLRGWRETRPTVLAGRDCGQIPVPLGLAAVHVVFPFLLFAWRHVLTRRTPMGRKEMGEIRHHGGPMLRVKREDLAARGVERTPSRVVGVTRRPADARRRHRRRRGQRHLGDRLRPALRLDRPAGHRRGRLAAGVPRRRPATSPGLFFCGLAFQYAFASMVLPGVGRDAAHVAQQVVRRTAARTSAARRSAHVGGARQSRSCAKA